MKLNEKKFFELAKENKLEAADIFFHRNYALSMSLYHGEVDSFSEHDSYAVTARGILNGKFGTVTTEAIDKDTPKFLVDGIVRTAKIIENNDPSVIFKGSEKYHKKSVYRKDVATGDIDGKIKILKEIEKKLLAYDKRINEVASVGYEESVSEDKLSNSYGLKLAQKQADYAYFVEVTAKQGDEVRSGYKVFASLNPEDFDIDKFVEEAAKNALEKLGSVQCVSKKYPVILNPKTASSLLKYLLASMDAEEVQKHSSFLEGKLHQQVISKKLTVIEDPLKKSIFFRYFDDEGVATNKKYLFKKGVLETYLYTLRTAMIDKVEPTGNGYRGGGNASADTSLTVVKPGKISEKEVISSIKEGIYLNDLQGLHAGMNAQSGNFSLQAAGFMIRDGKIAEPLSLITVADNLLDMFNKVRVVCNNSELISANSMECPSILISKMAISGK